MNHSEQAAAAAALVKFGDDLLTWATQPAEALPEGWRAAYQERLNEVAGLVRRAFSEDREALAKLREVETEARDFIGILAANPAIAAKPVSEWPVADFRETFERLAAGRRWFGDRVRSLDSEDATQRSRKPSRGAAAGIDPSSNPFEKARQVLEEFAFIEDREPPFDLQQIELDPAAAQAWGLCVDAVAALPDEAGPWGIASKLRDRFAGTHSRPVAVVKGEGALWRWLNAPSGPWVNRHELQALRVAAAEFERQRSRTASTEAATQPAGPAIVEGPAASPERAAAENPGSAPSGSPVAAEGTQGASGEGVQWSQPRPRKAWLNLLAELEHPPFTGETAWKKHIQRDPDSFSGPPNFRRITRAKSQEWGLRLPEFDADSK